MSYTVHWISFRVKHNFELSLNFLNSVALINYDIMLVMGKQMLVTNIYTDGACSDNQSGAGLGGWGAVLEYGSHRKEIWGAEPATTNNRMEMSALIGAFDNLTKDGLCVNVFSDSSYLTECFRKKWYEKWGKNGWMTAKKTPVENRDLWERLLECTKRHDVTFYRVKGHVTTGSASEAALRKLFAKFQGWNGAKFTYDDFLHVTEMNNRADDLANQGVNSLRQKPKDPR
jgi:ribonuclease HI